jgi:PEGA domain
VRVRLALVAALLVTLGAASPARAQSAEAETHFKRGVSLYQEADFKTALVEFRRAYELSHNWRLLYNVAQAEYQTHEYAASLSSFETFLHEGGDRIPRPRRAEVEQEIARLRLKVGRLTIRANVTGATVVIDDEALGPAPLTHNVAVGGRRIVVKKDGYVAWSKNVEIASGDDLLFNAVLEAVPSLGSSPLPPPPPPPQPQRFFWEPWAVTGVLTAAAVTTGILALGASSKLDDEKARFDVTDGELDDASSRVKTFALVTDILVLAAVASAGVSVYFTLKPPAFAGARVQIAPSVSGLLALGRF